MTSRTVMIDNNLVPNYRLSAYILICKTLNVAGVLFVAFSCLQQGSVSNGNDECRIDWNISLSLDSLWPIRVMCVLVIVNLLVESIHFVLSNCLFYTTTSIIIILRKELEIVEVSSRCVLFSRRCHVYLDNHNCMLWNCLCYTYCIRCAEVLYG